MHKQKHIGVLAPANPLRNPLRDAASVSSFLAQRTTGPVVLVGHSYGGTVISGAALGGGDVKALVCVDAFIPDERDTAFALQHTVAKRAGSTVNEVAGSHVSMLSRPGRRSTRSSLLSAPSAEGASGPVTRLLMLR